MLNSKFGNPSVGICSPLSVFLQPRYSGVAVCEYLYWKFTVSIVNKQWVHTLAPRGWLGLCWCCSCGCLAADTFQVHLPEQGGLKMAI